MRWLGIIGLAALAGYLLTGVRQIRPGERAVVTRWGRIVDTPGAGLYVGLPYGIDRVDRIGVDSVRRVHVGFHPEFEDDALVSPPGQLLTGDHNLVNVQVAVDYAVTDSDATYYLMIQANADGVISRVAEAVIAEWIAGHKVDEILLSAKAKLPVYVRHRLQERLGPYRLGVAVQGASITYLHPPREVQPAFDKVTEAQAEIQTRENDAHQQAQVELRRAEAEANQIEKLSLAYQQEQLGLAHAEADAFRTRLAQYQKLSKNNPGYLNGIWWEEMGKLFTKLRENGRIDLLDHHLGPDGIDLTTLLASPDKKK